MHDNGTAKQAYDRISTPGISQAVRSNSDLPARAWGAASTLPQRPTVRAIKAPSRPQCDIFHQHPRSRQNGQIDLIDLAEIGSSRWEQQAYSSQRVEPILAK